MHLYFDELSSEVEIAQKNSKIMLKSDDVVILLSNEYSYILDTTDKTYTDFKAGSGINYNDDFVFDNKNTTSQYIDSSIASNIQHSLKYYNYGNHFRNLITLYENNELTNVINRVVEDINHRFTKEVLTKKFLSNDLAISAKNLRSDKQFNNIYSYSIYIFKYSCFCTKPIGSAIVKN